MPAGSSEMIQEIQSSGRTLPLSQAASSSRLTATWISCTHVRYSHGNMKGQNHYSIQSDSPCGHAGSAALFFC